nr:retrotransposon protein, putative, Ty1-copia subclass [Tanacetum cinerariifolium]
MRALLIQHECEAALEVLPNDMEAQVKAELNKKAQSAVTLCLGNMVLREVTEETTTAGVWTKLETLYMTKSLANKLYLKKKLYTSYMPTGRKISEHIDEFNKIVLDLANIEVKFEDEDLALLLLTSLSASYEHFVDTLLYGWEALTLEDMMATLNSKKIKERSKAKGDDGEGLYVRRRTDQALLDLIMDTGCSYHMTRKLDILFDFLECDGGSVLLGNNKEYKIRSIGKSGKVKVINGSSVVLSETRSVNCVYSLDGQAVAGEFNASVDEKDSLAQVWHKRLRHISEAGLHVLEKFDVGRHTTQGVIGYVHSYLWGPSHVEALKGKRYFLSIIDDYSRRLVENQTGRTVKKLRTDTGLNLCNWEFEQLCMTDTGLKLCNWEFEHLCIESVIARHLTVAGMPHQNGLADHTNRTLMDKPRHPGDYGMLRIFGCVAYSYVKQCKLEPRAVKCVLSGYPEGVKGYKLYRFDGESPEIVNSRNVIFNESVMYKDTLKDFGTCNDKSVEELQVGVELQRLNNHTLKEDQIDQEDGDDEDAGDQETNQTHDLTDYQLTRDREPMTRTKPLRFQDESNMAAYAFFATEEEDTHEPLTYQEAVAYEDSSKWKAVMKEEMDSPRKNKTWELVDPLAGQKLVSSKWLFKIKEGINGVQKPRYKERLVARGFTQRAGIDYNKVFSLTVRHISIQVILALTTCKDYELEQLDVKTTFLHENLEEVIYMRQPPGYEQGNKVCLLKKSFYGLKQSPRQWYKKSDEYMISNGFKRSSYDSCVYYRSYALEFDMKELEEAKKILDNEKSVKMPLGGHFKLSLKDCLIRDCDVERMSKVPFVNAVGSLMHLMVYMRPNICRGNHVEVTGFVDSDYAKDSDKGREVLEVKTVKVLKVGTEHNAADALTKVVSGLKLQYCLELMNVGVG